MPIRTETYDLAAEYERLTDALEDSREEAEAAAENTAQREQARQRAAEIANRREGLAKFAEAFPDTHSVTLGELSPAEYAALENYLPASHGTQEYRTVMTGVATVDAPYVVEGDTEQTITTVRDDVPAFFTRWVSARADELLRADGVDENPFSKTSDRGSQ